MVRLFPALKQVGAESLGVRMDHVICSREDHSTPFACLLRLGSPIPHRLHGDNRSGLLQLVVGTSVHLFPTLKQVGAESLGVRMDHMLCSREDHSTPFACLLRLGSPIPHRLHGDNRSGLLQLVVGTSVHLFPTLKQVGAESLGVRMDHMLCSREDHSTPFCMPFALGISNSSQTAW